MKIAQTPGPPEKSFAQVDQSGVFVRISRLGRSFQATGVKDVFGITPIQEIHSPDGIAYRRGEFPTDKVTETPLDEAIFSLGSPLLGSA